jgi:hypothetical protein
VLQEDPATGDMREREAAALANLAQFQQITLELAFRDAKAIDARRVLKNPVVEERQQNPSDPRHVFTG